jgi:hypothetical protein
MKEEEGGMNKSILNRSQSGTNLLKDWNGNLLIDYHDILNR